MLTRFRGTFHSGMYYKKWREEHVRETEHIALCGFQRKRG